MNDRVLIRLCVIGLVGMFLSACGGPAQERTKERERRPTGTTSEADVLDAGNYAGGGLHLKAGTRLLRDLPYGSDDQQRLDVYLPAHANAAPLLVMVHGGAWTIGDKGAAGFVSNKTAHWLPKGYGLVSVNYRLSKQPNPIEQAEDIGRVLAYVQTHAQFWGADPSKIVLLGHSAGAHLVSLITADPRLATAYGAAPWLGTIALDSAALDLVMIMESPHHFGFYDRIFGRNRAFWMEASPYHRLTAASVPMLAVCSTRRTDSCQQAEAFAEKAGQLGGTVTVRREDLSHGDINKNLGLPSDYTTAVDAFLHSLGLP